MTNKLPPVLAKHYTQKKIFLCRQPPRKGVETNSRPGQLKLLENAGRCWSTAYISKRLYFCGEIVGL